MTSEEVEKIVKNLPDDMKDVLLNGLNDSIKAMCDIADYMRKNFVPVSVIEDIKAELWMEGMNMTGEYQGVWVRYRDIERVIDKHISGKENEE